MGIDKTASEAGEDQPLFTHYTEELVTNNPFRPPKDDSCPIATLPNELLAQIFYHGTFFDDRPNEFQEEDDMEADLSPEQIENLEALNQQLEDAESTPEREAILDAFKLNAEMPEGSLSGDSDDEDDSSFGSKSDTDFDSSFQILVSHVCKRWREIALASPSLWTHLNFTDGAPFGRSIAYLERSQNLPLTIDIDCQLTRPVVSTDSEDTDSEDEEGGAEEPFFSFEDVELIIQLVVPHVSRWRAFQLTTDNYRHLHVALQAFSKCSSAPMLEVLELYHNDDADDAEVFEPANLNEKFQIFGGIAPKLTNLSLWGVHIDWSSPGIYQNLIDLELAYHAKDVRPDWDTFLSIISSSPALETLGLIQSGPSGPSNTWPADPPVELRSVKNLLLCYHEPEYIEALMKCLSFPSCDTLSIDYDEGDYTDFAKQLASPAPGKKTSLLSQIERLKISGLSASTTVIDQIYPELQRCKSLNLNLYSLEPEWIERLSTPLEKDVKSLPLPQLETLTTIGLAGVSVRELVSARREAGFPLKKVCMGEEDMLASEDEHWLKDNVELEFFEPSDSDEWEFEEEDPDDLSSISDES